MSAAVHAVPVPPLARWHCPGTDPADRPALPSTRRSDRLGLLATPPAPIPARRGRDSRTVSWNDAQFQRPRIRAGCGAKSSGGSIRRWHTANLILTAARASPRGLLRADKPVLHGSAVPGAPFENGPLAHGWQYEISHCLCAADRSCRRGAPPQPGPGLVIPPGLYIRVSASERCGKTTRPWRWLPICKQ